MTLSDEWNDLDDLDDWMNDICPMSPPRMRESTGFLPIIRVQHAFAWNYHTLPIIKTSLEGKGVFFLLGKICLLQNLIFNAWFNALRQLGKVEVIEHPDYITVTVEGEGHFSRLCLKLELTIVRTKENEYGAFYRRHSHSSDIFDLEACRKNSLQLFQLEHATLLKKSIQLYLLDMITRALKK